MEAGATDFLPKPVAKEELRWRRLHIAVPRPPRLPRPMQKTALYRGSAQTVRRCEKSMDSFNVGFGK
jgi:hypothetical protein